MSAVIKGCAEPGPRARAAVSALRSPNQEDSVCGAILGHTARPWSAWATSRTFCLVKGKQSYEEDAQSRQTGRREGENEKVDCVQE